MTTRKLGLLLLPLVPLSAFGIVDIVDRLLPAAPTTVTCRPVAQPPAAPLSDLPA